MGDNGGVGDPPTKVRLARIFISHDGKNEYEWDGTQPEPGDTLFVYYVTVSDKTYNTFIKDGDDKRTFDHFRSKKNNVTISYLYSPNIIRKAPPLHIFEQDFVNREKQNQEELLRNLMASERIFQNTDLSCWYKLESPDVYSDEYHEFKEAYDFLDVNVYDVLNQREYMSISKFVPRNIDLKRLKQEIGVNHPKFRRILKGSSPPDNEQSKRRRTEGGGKTRRKCKVKKRRNRRRRNTMKRRKTTAKRRHR
jgi:hypothetical protein